MTHPVQAKRIGDLGSDYLIDWVRTWLLRRPTDPGYAPGLEQRIARAQGPLGLLRTVWEDLGAIATLSTSVPLREEVEALQAMLGSTPEGNPREVLAPVMERLSAVVMRMESDNAYRFGEPLDNQLSSDSMGVLRTLALIRHCLAGDPIPLAAPLLPRDAVPASGTRDSSALLEVIEVGDLGDPFCRAGHQRVHAELQGMHAAIRWRWLHFSSVQHWNESEPMAALLEAVASLAPGRFWDAVNRLCETTPYGAEKAIKALLADAGIDAAALASWLADRSHDEARQWDRKMALACGAPYLRPLFVAGRRLFIGLDASAAMRDFANTRSRDSGTS